jgi:hypothetical protein
MVKPKVDDQTFLALWEKHKSPTKLARIIGVDVRAIHKRRRVLEGRMGSILDTAEPIRPVVPKEGAQHELAVKAGSVVVFSDVHVWPDERPSLAQAGLHWVLEHLPNIKAVVNNGDVLDGARISRHAPTEWAHMPTVEEELQAVSDFLEQIECRVPPEVPLLWNVGNHDCRFSVRIASMLPELAGVKGTDLKDHVSERWSWAWSTLINRGVIGGATLIKHRFRGGIHATWNNTLHAGVTTVTGHLHQAKVTPITDVNGRRWGVDTGTLSRFEGQQKYIYAENSPLNWGQAFAVLTYDHEGRLAPPELCEVIGDNCWFRGQVVASE